MLWDERKGAHEGAIAQPVVWRYATLWGASWAKAKWQGIGATQPASEYNQSNKQPAQTSAGSLYYKYVHAYIILIIHAFTKSQY